MIGNDMSGGGVNLRLPSCHAEDLRVELWGSFLTVSGTRTGAAMGLRRPRARPMGAGLVLRRELDHGFFSATWRLPVSRRPHPSTFLWPRNRARMQCENWHSWAMGVSVAIHLIALVRPCANIVYEYTLIFDFLF